MVTILTAPILSIALKELIFGKINHKLKSAKYLLKLCMFRPMMGHSGVTVSLLRGLEILKIPFNLNPKSIKLVHENCIVLSDVYALEIALYLKRIGIIKKLFAGPNLVVEPENYNNVLANYLIDKVIVPSEWVRDMYLRRSELLNGKILVWACGIDLNLWPSARKNADNFLVYVKNQEEIADDVIAVLRQHGLKYNIIRYGSYTEEQYKNLLAKTKFLIYISKSESQSISLLESWASNVPTLVWNPGKWTAYDGVVYEASSAPYLTKELGCLFSNISEFRNILLNINITNECYRPREWVAQNMTTEIAAEKLMACMQEEN